MACLRAGTHRRGIVAVEFALVLPLLLLLLLGVLEWGWLFYNFHQVKGAARRGARVAIRPFADNDECLTVIGNIMDGAGLGDTGYTVTFTPADISSAYTTQEVKVSINVPYPAIALFGGTIVPIPDNLKAAVTMAKEGP